MKSIGSWLQFAESIMTIDKSKSAQCNWRDDGPEIVLLFQDSGLALPTTISLVNT